MTLAKVLTQDAALRYPRGRTALLVIDPVNDFLSEDGAGWDLVKNSVRMHGVVGNLKAAIEGARERRIPVLFGPMAFTQEDYTDAQLQRRSPINRLMFERQMFLAGSWGADFHADLRPRDDETVLLPHKSIDVFETDLPEHLERLGTTHLVIAGMTASLCCESTGRHAMEHGYDVTFLANAIGGESVPGWEVSVHLSYPLVANAVLNVDEFLAAADGAEEAALVRAGDTVRGSDGGEIGTVAEVIEANADTASHVRVPRGLIFARETYIPLEAVVRRVGSEVFINVPKLVMVHMPWGEPPSHGSHEAKRGPRQADVQRLYGSRSPSSRR